MSPCIDGAVRRLIIGLGIEVEMLADEITQPFQFIQPAGTKIYPAVITTRLCFHAGLRVQCHLATDKLMDLDEELVGQSLTPVALKFEDSTNRLNHPPC